MRKYLTIIIIVFLVSVLITKAASPYVQTVPQGGTGWGNVQSGTLLTGNGTGKLATTTNAIVSGWAWDTTYNELSLTPTSTIPIWIKDNVYASSTIFAPDLTIGSAALLGSATSTFLGGVNMGSTTAGFFWDSVNNRLSLGSEHNTHTISGITYGENLSLHQIGATDLAEYVGHRHTDTAGFGSHLLLSRSRGTEDNEAVVQNGDYLARLTGLGYDGVDYEQAAQIDVLVDGTPGSGDMPGRMMFLTTPDGGVNPVEHMRITSGGLIGIGTTSPFAKLSVAGAGFFNDSLTASNITATGTLSVLGLSTFGDFTATNATTTNATSTNLYVSGQTRLGSLSGLTLATSGIISAYGGTSCTSQFIRSLNGSGTATCASINNGDWSGTDLSVANGGTGLSTFGGTNHILYTTTADNLASEAAFTYNSTTDLLTATYASSTALTTSGGAWFATNGGNVGIGTTTPWGLLSINPNALGAGVPSFVIGSSTATSFIVNNGGRVGVGTVAPRTKLHLLSAGTQNVAGDQDNASMIVEGSNLTTTSNNANLVIHTNTAAAIDVGGTLGLGGLYRTGSLDPVNYALIRGGKENGTNANFAGYLAFSTRANGGNNAEWMRISSTGNVIIANLTTLGYVCTTAAGTLSAGGASCPTSLRAHKDNIENLTIGLDALMELRPVEFDWKEGFGIGHDLGFIAEEVVDVNPILGNYVDGALRGVKYEMLTSLLTKSIQEIVGGINNMWNWIQNHETRLQKAEKEIELLKKEIEVLKNK